jgi:hypothetical protein
MEAKPGLIRKDRKPYQFANFVENVEDEVCAPADGRGGLPVNAIRQVAGKGLGKSMPLVTPNTMAGQRGS